MTKIWNILGTMSGTSMDGIDLGVLRIEIKDSDNLEWPEIIGFGPSVTIPYSKAIKKELFDTIHSVNQPSSHSPFISTADPDIIHIDHVITKEHKKAIQGFIKDYAIDLDFISMHGHTLFHDTCGDSVRTHQLGDRNDLEKQLNIRMFPNLRHIDIEHGGQGAPLVPIFHLALANQWRKYQSSQDQNMPIMMINIGGVSNITWMPNKQSSDMIAMDMGPGIGLLDDWISSKTDGQYAFDKDGFFAKKGVVQKEIVDLLLEDDYLRKQSPKSLDRLHFQYIKDVIHQQKLSIEDGAATLVECTVRAMQYHMDILLSGYNSFGDMKKRQAIKPVIFLHGGGMHHPVIYQKIVNYAQKRGAKIQSFFDIDPALSPDFIEAWAFAYLGICHHLNMPISVPGTTGARFL